MIISPLPARPWYRITQKFGSNPELNKKFGHLGHAGIDFAPWRPGTAGYVIHAPHDGHVKLRNDPDGYGLYVEITGYPYNAQRHQRNSILAHLSKTSVTEGQWVGAGDPIGVMGNTGNSTNVHLHWTYRKMKDGVVLDKENGFGGALDIAPYTLQWTNHSLVD